ncbi:MAG: hypothetical protein KF734_02130 [Saprospiraceae bacterium]|nr:hypothetical protein [Saprospiraceae bacterium]
MTEQLILRELHNLPEAQQNEVLQFIQFLQWRQRLQEVGLIDGELSVETDPFAAMDLIYEKDIEALETIAGVKIKR